MQSSHESKFRPRTGREGPERECNSTVSLTSALDEGEWSPPRHGRFTPREKDSVPIASGPSAGVDKCGKFRPHRDSIPTPSRPVASRYTDCTIPPPPQHKSKLKLNVALFRFCSTYNFVSALPRTELSKLHHHVETVLLSSTLLEIPGFRGLGITVGLRN